MNRNSWGSVHSFHRNDVDQAGTVIESASDFFGRRLSKKERKATLADEILSDRTLKDYRWDRILSLSYKCDDGVDLICI